jgi:hypothetical protein
MEEKIKTRTGEPNLLERALEELRERIAGIFFDKSTLKVTVQIVKKLDGKYKKTAGYSGEMRISMGEYSSTVGNLQDMCVNHLDQIEDEGEYNMELSEEIIDYRLNPIFRFR